MKKDIAKNKNQEQNDDFKRKMEELVKKIDELFDKEELMLFACNEKVNTSLFKLSEDASVRTLCMNAIYKSEQTDKKLGILMFDAILNIAEDNKRFENAIISMFIEYMRQNRPNNVHEIFDEQGKVKPVGNA